MDDNLCEWGQIIVDPTVIANFCASDRELANTTVPTNYTPTEQETVITIDDTILLY